MNTGVGSHFLLQGIFPTKPGTEHTTLESTAFAGRFFTTVPPRKPIYLCSVCVCVCVCVCVYIYIYVVQLLGHVLLFGNPVDCSTPGLLVLHHLPKLAQSHVVESVLLSNYIVLGCPLLLLSSVFPGTRVFFNESALCIRWPKY